MRSIPSVQDATTLTNELQAFQEKAKTVIIQLYQKNVRDHKGNVLPEVFLTEEWEWEGATFNALTEQGLAYISNGETLELFTWNELDAESLVEVVHILEDKDFD